MFTIIEDTVECHDLYMPACRQEMYQLLYGRTHLEVMHTCYDNLRTAFEPFGIPKEDMYYPFNAFMNTVIDEKESCLSSCQNRCPVTTFACGLKWTSLWPCLHVLLILGSVMDQAVHPYGRNRLKEKDQSKRHGLFHL